MGFRLMKDLQIVIVTSLRKPPIPNPRDNPVVNPRYFTTGHDRAVIRAGIRTALKAMGSEPLKPYLMGETPPSGMPVVSSNSSDEELDARVNAISWSWLHAGRNAVHILTSLPLSSFNKDLSTVNSFGPVGKQNPLRKSMFGMLH
ncbi:hypothetical protein B0O99DRAFT_683149 [Bisporella sp. PMI_857]|nr:hypothetical protein B0O99DRAFT_683149 [Bisporella sp. PMI_857]